MNPMGVSSVMSNLSRRKFIQYSSVAATTSLLAIGSQRVLASNEVNSDTIQVGIRYSTTGHLAAVEKPLLHSTLLAIEHINSGVGAWAGNGVGIAGKKIEPIIINPGSNWEQYKQAEQRLFEEKHVTQMMDYHIADEREMQDAVTMLHRDNGLNGFFVRTDHPYAKAAIAAGQTTLRQLGGSIIGNESVELDASDLNKIIASIKATRPDFIVSGLVGDEAILFSKSLSELGMLNSCLFIGGYPTAVTPADKAFTKQFQAKFGTKQTMNYRIQTVYTEAITMAKGMKHSSDLGMPV